MTTKLEKLRNSSLHELRVRGSQALAALAERQGWSRGAKLKSDNEFLELLAVENEKFPSPSAWHDHFRRRKDPSFFPSFDDRDGTCCEFRGRWPASVDKIIERAKQIRSGHFDLLGFRELSFGDPIDWRLEPLANKSAPLVHWSQLNYLDADLLGDKKIVWELNRHQYFGTLGQAYWLTNDERYAETFVNHVNSWMDQNPPKLGVNWASSLEVAFRSISWLWALYFFTDSPALTSETFLRICKFLYVNARHLETYLSTYFSPNTHLTGEALGLFYLGTLLPEFKESPHWRNKGLQILLEQLPRHVKPDGVYFEQSSYYHRYTADFYLHLRLLLTANRQTVPPEVDEKLSLLLDHLMYITKPDGTTPLFGDDDGGRLMTLSHPAANDFRNTLSTGAAVFERADYKFVAGGVAEDSLWLLGRPGVDRLDALFAVEPEKQSIGFPNGGYYVMRDGWTAKSNYLLFDCGPHGTDNCGHAHADALSFELAFGGATVLVDPGTYTYTGSREMRDWFRSSVAHNTVTLDRESSSIPNGPFSWNSIAHSECLSWITDERFDYVLATHDGFKRLSEPATYRRSVLFIKHDYWVVRDQVESAGKHTLQAWFHVDRDVGTLDVEENRARVDKLLQIAGFATNLELKEEPAWVSDCYGEKTQAPVVVFTVLANGSKELVTFLLPSDARVTELEAQNGTAFEIDRQDGHDILLLRDSGQVEIGRIISDFDLTWLRFGQNNSQEPEELIVINGHTVECNGRALLKSTENISHRSMRINAEQYVRN
jgi:heparinase II/III-like protein